jgi:hypothetical protein
MRKDGNNAKTLPRQHNETRNDRYEPRDLGVAKRSEQTARGRDSEYQSGDVRKSRLRYCGWSQGNTDFLENVSRDDRGFDMKMYHAFFPGLAFE